MGVGVLAFEDVSDGVVRLAFWIDATRHSQIDIPLSTIEDWSARYREVVQRSKYAGREALLGIGHGMVAALDTGGAFTRALGLPGDRNLEIRLPLDQKDVPAARAVEELPWELLAVNGQFLAANGNQLFAVVRRHGEPVARKEPQYSDLSLLFMAASPEDVSDLDYEAEEAAILAATAPAGMARPLVHLAVDETGTLAGLSQSLRDSNGTDILHLSCHGGRSPKLGAFLAFETNTGDKVPVTAGELLTGLRAQVPQLAFVSACYTAAAGPVIGDVPAGVRDGEKYRDTAEGFGEGGQYVFDTALRDMAGDGASDGLGTAEAFTRQLLVQVPHVVGWDGTVGDGEATLFATVFYGSLGQGETVAIAAARARAQLLSMEFDYGPKADKVSADWHLARVHLNIHGGSVLCQSGLPGRPIPQDNHKTFLDAKRGLVEVAPRAQFVGRRREIQRTLAALGDGQPVLVSGMGNLGKSSLAARVAGRIQGLSSVVVFGKFASEYDASAIFARIADGLPGEAPSLLFDDLQLWSEQVAQNSERFEVVLKALLTRLEAMELGILLIIDDLEKALEEPGPSETVKLRPRFDAQYVALRALLRAFGLAQTRSRLLFTSRYDFEVIDRTGTDLAGPDRLARVPLRPMKPESQAKQLRALARTEGVEAVLSEDRALLGRAAEAAGGNPWLQKMLQEPILKGEVAAVTPALEALEAYRRDGTAPEDSSATSEFLAKEIVDRLGRALTSDQTKALRAATLFSQGIPIPQSAFAAAAAEADVATPQAALARLMALGLLEPWGDLNGHPHGALNPLAFGLTAPLDDTHLPAYAAAALNPLKEAWQDRSGGFPVEPRGVEATRLAILAQADADLLDAALEAGTSYLWHVVEDADAALALLQAGLAVMPAGRALDADILRIGVEAADRLGQGAVLDALLARPARQSGQNAPEAAAAQARLDLRRSERLLRRGDSVGAQEVVERVQGLLETLPQERRLLAVTKGKIADIYQMRGDLEGALSIRLEEQLPVYDELGDRRSVAVTKGKIADIYQMRGDLEGALSIRLEEELPVYDELGDRRSVAVTKGQIADIYQMRGDLEGALSIRLEEELPVYDELGDRRSVAVTKGQIADIYQMRGDLEGALSIRLEEVLPVFDELGDRREIAVTKGKIADIYEMRGDLEGALSIRLEEELPVYDELGDRRSVAVTKGKIADIYQMRGDLEGALSIRLEEQLPVYDELGDRREIAVTKGKIADIYQMRGDLEGALSIRLEEELPVYGELGDRRSVAVTKGQIADIYQMRGDLEGALSIRLEEELPVYDELGDRRSVAVTKGKIADIYQMRGDLEGALSIRLEEVLPVYDELGDRRSVAVTKGQIADIYQMRGDLEGALSIRLEEVLPVYDELGDRRSVAVTKGKIADIYQMRGDLEGALSIRLEEQLPVYDELGDRREIALTKGKIADIYQMRGDLEGALSIRLEEELPVYGELGDRRSVAVTKGQIADIYQMRGDLEGALSIRLEEELPVYDELGDRRSVAVTKGKIADIYQMRGDLEGALSIRLEEVLPVYDELGDRRSVAVTKGQIADIYQMRGDLEGALSIRLEEVLPVYDELGDRRSVAVTKGQIADIYQMRGDLEGALSIRLEEELPVYDELGDRRSVAVTKGKIADIYQMRGDLEGALATHLERLDTAQELQDIGMLAHIRYSCADIRLRRGDHENGGIQTIYDELAEAFAINQHLQRPDGIAAVGSLLAQVFDLAGHRQEALNTLDAVADAQRLLNDETGLAQTAQLRTALEQLPKSGDGAGDEETIDE